MDVCLPEEFLRLTGADDRNEVAADGDWLGAEAWVAPTPRATPRSQRTLMRDDPTWRVV
jgi:hypothetical protein